MELAGLTRRIAEHATASDDGMALLTIVCTTLADVGLPLWRVGVSMPALDPLAATFSMTWTSDGGATKSHTTHREDGGTEYQQSPIRTLVEQDVPTRRWRLDTLAPDEPYPMLHRFRAEGGTDYILHLVLFTPGTALRGVALSFTTRQPGGFDTAQEASLAALVPIVGLAMAKLALSHTLRRTLGTYLGTATGEHVLGGRIKRGEGRTIWAAVLLADLRGFTALADRSDPAAVVGWLDEHFDALGEPVLERGGEILKFLGDGFLAVFPVASPDAHLCQDCGKAFEAAVAADEANRALNRRREAEGLPGLAADLVLHFGEVVYGNVGTRQRLDFTVIGRAVNEASRIEKSCGTLGRSILISDSFARRCPHPTVPVGVIPLRGLERPQQVWGLPDDLAGDGRAAGGSADAMMVPLAPARSGPDRHLQGSVSSLGRDVPP